MVQRTIPVNKINSLSNFLEGEFSEDYLKLNPPPYFGEGLAWTLGTTERLRLMVQMANSFHLYHDAKALDISIFEVGTKKAACIVLTPLKITHHGGCDYAIEIKTSDTFYYKIEGYTILNQLKRRHPLSTKDLKGLQDKIGALPLPEVDPADHAMMCN